jgi:hypothetical protein
VFSIEIYIVNQEISLEFKKIECKIYTLCKFNLLSIIIDILESPIKSLYSTKSKKDLEINKKIIIN